MKQDALNEQLLQWALSRIVLLEKRILNEHELTFEMAAEIVRWKCASDQAEKRIARLEKWGNDIHARANTVGSKLRALAEESEDLGYD